MKTMGLMFVVMGGLMVASMELRAESVQQGMDCSRMSSEFQQFASHLSPENKMIFCGQFTEGQRASALQMAAEPNAQGTVMAPDEAVQKVREASGAAPQQKMPTGCPVK